MHHHCPLLIRPVPCAGPGRISSNRALRSASCALVLGWNVLFLSACASLDDPGLTSVERNFERRPYVGAGVLISQLDPGVQQFEELSVDDDQSAGASLTLGYDLGSRLAIEGHFASLGEASLDPEGDVSYQVGGVSALLYGINEQRDRARREGLSFFGRAGIGSLNSDSDLPVERVNDVHLVLGVGLEYGLSSGLAGRLELVSHDSDANYGQLGLVYRFGGGKSRSTRLASTGGEISSSSADSDAQADTAQVNPAPEVSSGLEIKRGQRESEVVASPIFREALKPKPVVPTTDESLPNEAVDSQADSKADSGFTLPETAALDDTDSARSGLIIQRLDRSPTDRSPTDRSPTDDRSTESAATGLLVTRKPRDKDGDGIPDASDDCASTSEGRPVDERGCDLFDGVVEGVTFQIASNRLTDSALAVLAEVATTLKAYPDIRVSIDAHTDDRGNAQSNLLLSKRRALEVTRYLVAQGIAGNRLMPNAFGEARPVDSNETSEGRRRNRRVEFRILE